MTNTNTSFDECAAALAELRPSLLKFAQFQLKNLAWAEDVVSETMIAILEKPDAFSNISNFKTWTIGILKHKIIDLMRKHQREIYIETQEDQQLDQALEQLFDETGHWLSPVQHWPSPETAFESKEFFEILDICIEKLPENLARVFMMREWLELDTEEICQTLNVTASNCWVILYRARMRLRECLEVKWLNKKPSTTP